MAHPDPEFQERGMKLAELGTRKRIAELLRVIAADGRKAQEFQAWFADKGRTRDGDEIVAAELSAIVGSAEAALKALEADQ